MIEGSIIEQIDSLEVFKISCSQIGKIMSESKRKSFKDKIAAQNLIIQETESKIQEMKDGKSKDNTVARNVKNAQVLRLLEQQEKDEGDKPDLSVGAKTYCETWVKSRLYKIRQQFGSKYTEKGNREEDLAIDYCEKVAYEGADGWFLAKKNTERRNNEFAEGECDVELVDEIADMKNSWDFKTFPLFDKVIPNTDYEWQIQGYMWLWQKGKGRVIYVLMSLPEDMIMKEVWKNFGYGANYSQNEFDTFTAQFRYDDYPRELRIKEFKFDFDESKIEQIKYKVGECRKYIEILKAELKDSLKDWQEI